MRKILQKSIEIIQNIWNKQWNSDVVTTESVSQRHFSSFLHEVLCERRPTASPISRHVLVRPGISAYGSELCSSSPPSESQRQHRNIDHSEQCLLPERRSTRWLTSGSWASPYTAYARESEWRDMMHSRETFEIEWPVIHVRLTDWGNEPDQNQQCILTNQYKSWIS